MERNYARAITNCSSDVSGKRLEKVLPVSVGNRVLQEASFGRGREIDPFYMNHNVLIFIFILRQGAGRGSLGSGIEYFLFSRYHVFLGLDQAGKLGSSES